MTGYRKATANAVASSDKIRKSMPRETKSGDSEVVIGAMTQQCERAGELDKALAKTAIENVVAEQRRRPSKSMTG